MSEPTQHPDPQLTEAPVYPDAPAPDDAMSDTELVLAKRRLTYRFWTSVVSLLLAGVFGALAIGSVSAGYGLSRSAVDPARAAEVTLAFEVLGGVFVVLTLLAMWLTYKLRPGGD